MKTAYYPQFGFYHLNCRGTGCAAFFKLHPATNDKDGEIVLTMRCQKTVVGDCGVRVFFDSENDLVVRLCFDDLCQILQVFRGEIESINDGKGMYHESIKEKHVVRLRHVIEPTYGYSLEVFEYKKDTNEERMIHIFLSPSEAFGLCEAISNSMSLICFGVPSVVPESNDASEVMRKIADA